MSVKAQTKGSSRRRRGSDRCSMCGFDRSFHLTPCEGASYAPRSSGRRKISSRAVSVSCTVDPWVARFIASKSAEHLLSEPTFVRQLLLRGVSAYITEQGEDADTRAAFNYATESENTIYVASFGLNGEVMKVYEGRKKDLRALLDNGERPCLAGDNLLGARMDLMAFEKKMTETTTKRKGGRNEGV